MAAAALARTYQCAFTWNRAPQPASGAGARASVGAAPPGADIPNPTEAKPAKPTEEQPLPTTVHRAAAEPAAGDVSDDEHDLDEPERGCGPEALPSELLAHTLSFLLSDDRRRAGTVSRAWRRAFFEGPAPLEFAVAADVPKGDPRAALAQALERALARSDPEAAAEAAALGRALCADPANRGPLSVEAAAALLAASAADRPRAARVEVFFSSGPEFSSLGEALGRLPPTLERLELVLPAAAAAASPAALAQALGGLPDARGAACEGLREIYLTSFAGETLALPAGPRPLLPWRRAVGRAGAALRVEGGPSTLKALRRAFPALREGPGEAALRAFADAGVACRRLHLVGFDLAAPGALAAAAALLRPPPLPSARPAALLLEDCLLPADEAAWPLAAFAGVNRVSIRVRGRGPRAAAGGLPLAAMRWLHRGAHAGTLGELEVDLSGPELTWPARPAPPPPLPDLDRLPGELERLPEGVRVVLRLPARFRGSRFVDARLPALVEAARASPRLLRALAIPEGGGEGEREGGEGGAACGTLDRALFRYRAARACLAALDAAAAGAATACELRALFLRTLL
eukprot:tig00000310_g23944.t1